MNFAATLTKKRLRRSSLGARSGAAALEFALVAPFFFFLTGVAFDLGLLLFTQTVLNNATRDAARLIETNQTAGSASSFSSKLCSDMSGLVPCANLQYYVQAASSFSSMNAGIQTNAAGNLKSAGTFTAGTPGQDMVVQVAYNRPTLIPWAIQYLNGPNTVISHSSNLLVSTVAFQNEP